MQQPLQLQAVHDGEDARGCGRDRVDVGDALCGAQHLEGFADLTTQGRVALFEVRGEFTLLVGPSSREQDLLAAEFTVV
ncbi:hypothetical protein GCM10025863_23220 [Microbacterium suwonense]|uniref:Uncharacterized protein n=1 Tax=Microbacterium suwonense TaxID=683047 RepID=A0ABN6X6I3_9MICO|nr:hypothetical protein GCM10025863_23220 [Microbacterium suwonense]